MKYYCFSQMNPVLSQTSNVVYTNNADIFRDVILSSANCTAGIPWEMTPQDKKLYICQRHIVSPRSTFTFRIPGGIDWIYLSQSYSQENYSAFNFVPIELKPGGTVDISDTFVQRAGELHSHL